MAVFPVAPGNPDYSSTGTNRFIPQVWAAKLQTKFYDATYYSDITNNDYAG